MKKRMVISIFFLLVSTLFLTSLVVALVPPKVIDLNFINHIQANLPEQDVFVMMDEPTEVMRVLPADASKSEVLNKKIFATARETAHDPFQLGSNPLGPYKKGKALNRTLRQWLAATGSGTYTVMGEEAELMLSFRNLVPNGLYTVWCSRLTFPPHVKVVDKPCGSAGGKENVFMADMNGNGRFNLKLKPLPMSTEETATVIALAYHSDGKSHGANPGDFGLNSHVQIFSLLPVIDQEQCMREAVDMREDMLIDALHDYHDALVMALETRRTALMEAWESEGMFSRMMEIKNAWMEYSKARMTTKKMLQEAEQHAWQHYTTHRDMCMIKASDDPTLQDVGTPIL